MSSESNAAFQTAREAISVPTVPLEAIRRAAKATPETPKRKRLLAGVLGGLVLIGTAAAAAETWQHISLGFGKNGSFEFAAENVSMNFKRPPTQSDLEGAARSADFSVTYPAGLPEGSSLKRMMRLGTSGIFLVYDLPGAYRLKNHLMWIILANPKSVGHQGKLDKAFAMQLGEEAGKPAAIWQIGGETVILPKSTATAAEMTRIKAAMTEATHT